MPRKLLVESNWTTFEDQPLTKENFQKLFANEIPCVRHKSFLTPEECQRMVEIVEHQTTEFVGLRSLSQQTATLTTDTVRDTTTRSSSFLSYPQSV